MGKPGTFDPVPRDDGGLNYTDKRLRPWAVYPPNVVPTKKTTVYNGILPVGVNDAPLWPKGNLWVACLRMPAYGSEPWRPLATGQTKDQVAFQVEWFGEDDTDLVVSGKSDGGALVLLALLGLLLLSDGK